MTTLSFYVSDSFLLFLVIIFITLGTIFFFVYKRKSKKDLLDVVYGARMEEMNTHRRITAAYTIACVIMFLLGIGFLLLLLYRWSYIDATATPMTSLLRFSAHLVVLLS